MDERTTRHLENILSGISTQAEMESYMETPAVAMSAQDFPEYFLSLDKVRALTAPEIYHAADVDKSFYSQIMNHRKKPGRDTALRLCLGAGLSLKETTRALEILGHAPLYARNRRDIIISVAINHHATLNELNLLLEKYREKILE